MAKTELGDAGAAAARSRGAGAEHRACPGRGRPVWRGLWTGVLTCLSEFPEPAHSAERPGGNAGPREVGRGGEAAVL